MKSKIRGIKARPVQMYTNVKRKESGLWFVIWAGCVAEDQFPASKSLGSLPVAADSIQDPR